MRVPRKTLHVACLDCGRVRRVGVRTPAARAWQIRRRGEAAEHELRPMGYVRRTLRCRTCRLLRSIEEHRAAIRELETKVVERRARGL